LNHNCLGDGHESLTISECYPYSIMKRLSLPRDNAAKQNF